MMSPSTAKNCISETDRHWSLKQQLPSIESSAIHGALLRMRTTVDVATAETLCRALSEQALERQTVEVEYRPFPKFFFYIFSAYLS